MLINKVINSKFNFKHTYKHAHVNFLHFFYKFFTGVLHCFLKFLIAFYIEVLYLESFIFVKKHQFTKFYSGAGENEGYISCI